jgi:hypothetical protein
MKYFAIVEGDTGRVVAFHASERAIYGLKFGLSIIGEYPSYEIALRAVELGIRGWCAPRSPEQHQNR